MHPRARGLTAGVEALEGRAPPQVGAHPAAGVVLGRGDGEQLRRGVEAELATPRDDGREALLEEVGAELAAVEVDVVGAGLTHPGDDRPRHDVARSEVGQLVVALHEPHALLVDEEGALAAHGLGDERLLAARALAEPEHGGVELHELEVGQQAPARSAAAMPSPVATDGLVVDE